MRRPARSTSAAPVSAYTVDPATPRASNFHSGFSRSGQDLGCDLPHRLRRLSGRKGRLQRGSRLPRGGYTAAKVPENLNAQCPCTVFGTSKDDGKTFTYQLVPELPAEPASVAPAAEDAAAVVFGGGVMLAADQTKEGRYALARQSGNKLMVSLTEDGGKTWLPAGTCSPTACRCNFRSPGDEIFGHHGNFGPAVESHLRGPDVRLWSSASLDGGRSSRLCA